MAPVSSQSHSTEENLFHGCSAAQAANASGVLFSPPPGRDVVQMDCVGNECGLPFSIWASMVPRSRALDIAEVWTPLLDAIVPVSILPCSIVDNCCIHSWDQAFQPLIQYRPI